MLLDAGKVVRTQGGGLFVSRALAEAEKAFELWTKKSRGGKAKKTPENQEQAQHSSKSDANTLGSNENENENESIPNGIQQADFVFSVPDEALRNFREHRRKIKAPLSPRAEELLISKLEQIHTDHGHDSTAVIDQSILNGWRGVFELKGNNNGNRTSPHSGNGLLDAALEGMERRNGNSG